MHFAFRKPSKYPTYCTNPVASILWGMPMMTSEMEEKIAKGTWTLGGCCLEIPTAMWCCKACGADI